MGVRVVKPRVSERVGVSQDPGSDSTMEAGK